MYNIGKTALCIAAEENHRDIVDLLISSGSIIDKKIEEGNSMFHIRFL